MTISFIIFFHHINLTVEFFINVFFHGQHSLRIHI